MFFQKNGDSEKAKDITITADAKQADDGSTENVPLVLSPENQGIDSTNKNRVFKYIFSSH